MADRVCFREATKSLCTGEADFPIFSDDFDSPGTKKRKRKKKKKHCEQDASTDGDAVPVKKARKRKKHSRTRSAIEEAGSSEPDTPATIEEADRSDPENLLSASSDTHAPAPSEESGSLPSDSSNVVASTSAQADVADGRQKISSISEEPMDIDDEDADDNGDVSDVVENDEFDTLAYANRDLSSDENDEGDADIPEPISLEWREPMQSDDFVIPPFECHYGPTFDLDSIDREIDYFNKFLPNALIQHAVDETNKYAEYHQRYIAKKTNMQWKPTTLNELRAYFGLLIMMGVDRKSSVIDYWSSDVYLRNVGISTVMSRNRFQMLTRYFHLADPVNDPRRDTDPESRKRRCELDPLYKINPWLKPILANCQKNFIMGQHISIDEGMVAFKGRSKFKQRLPTKPDRDGFKVWQLCDSVSAYVANFEPYLGIKYKTAKEGARKEKNTIQKLVLRMIAPFEDNDHILYSDSLFTKIETAEILYAKGVYMVGSLNKRTRKGLPSQILPIGKAKKLKMKVGDSKSMIRVLLNDIQLNMCMYQDDSAQILILNTVFPPGGTETFSHNDEEREIPTCLARYRVFMGGVDRANQKRKYYHIGRKNNRWWIYMSSYLIDVCLVNAYECFKFANEDTLVNHKNFNMRVGKQLIGGYCGKTTKSPREVSATVTKSLLLHRENLPGHVPVVLPGRQKTCKQCQMSGIRTPSGRVPETSRGCLICNVHLHHITCFAVFHNAILTHNKKNVGTQTTRHIVHFEPPVPAVTAPAVTRGRGRGNGNGQTARGRVRGNGNGQTEISPHTTATRRSRRKR
jgi:hypothetical protein